MFLIQIFARGVKLIYNQDYTFLWNSESGRILRGMGNMVRILSLLMHFKNMFTCCCKMGSF